MSIKTGWKITLRVEYDTDDKIKHAIPVVAEIEYDTDEIIGAETKGMTTDTVLPVLLIKKVKTIEFYDFDNNIINDFKTMSLLVPI